MSLIEILTLCGMLLSVVGNVLTWTVFISKKFDKAREIQDAADAAMRNEFNGQMAGLKTEIKNDIDKAHTGVQIIREHFASKTEIRFRGWNPSSNPCRG
jgi:hypothetical protein